MLAYQRNINKYREPVTITNSLTFCLGLENVGNSARERIYRDDNFKRWQSRMCLLVAFVIALCPTLPMENWIFWLGARFIWRAAYGILTAAKVGVSRHFSYVSKTDGHSVVLSSDSLLIWTSATVTVFLFLLFLC